MQNIRGYRKSRHAPTCDMARVQLGPAWRLTLQTAAGPAELTVAPREIGSPLVEAWRAHILTGAPLPRDASERLFGERRYQWTLEALRLEPISPRWSRTFVPPHLHAELAAWPVAPARRRP